MIEKLRKQFNQKFTEKQYKAFLNDIYSQFNHQTPFRIAETPVIIPKALKSQILEACDQLIDVIVAEDFKVKTEASFHENTLRVPNETEKPLFLQFDFGICKDENGSILPQLIELQGFPSLYHFQDLLASTVQSHYDLPSELSPYPMAQTRSDYQAILKEAVLGGHSPEHVVLLEIEPEQQATAIDFFCAKKELGIELLCVSKMFEEGNQLFYINSLGEKVKIKRIYNRVIYDELDRRPDLKLQFDFAKSYDVEWAGHPNWFYRISKFSLPLFDSPYVPDTHYLDQLKELPSDLEHYVLKPLYSFAGAGVELHLTAERLEQVENKVDYILQKKVNYAPIIETLDVPAKMEIRIMMIWLPDESRPKIVNNLVRLSKGEMIGVKYNHDKTWVGGTIGFFES